MDEKEKLAREAFAAECAAASAVRGRKIRVVSDYPRYTIPTGAMVMRVQNGVPKALFGKRGIAVAKPGMIGIPAGYPMDLVQDEVLVENPENTVQREVHEETGLMFDIDRFEPMGANVTKQFLYGEPRLMHHSFYLVYVTEEEAETARPDGSDLVELYWYTQQEVEAVHQAGQIAVADSYMPYVNKAFALTKARLNGTATMWWPGGRQVTL